MAVATICLFVGLSSANAQGIRFQFSTVGVTVATNSATSSVIAAFPNTNNTVFLVNGATNAILNVSGLPAGATAAVTDTNGTPISSITSSAPVWITLNTTNVAEGIYAFRINAGGLDTNGVPVTNSFPLVLQSAHIWKGGGLGSAGFGVSNNWSTAANWVGGVPSAASDVVFSDSGAQTNAIFSSGISFTNVGIDTSVTIGSLRFAQSIYTNTVTTNALSHVIRMAQGVTLAVTGTNGFSLLRDYISEFGFDPDRTMTVAFTGTNATLLVSNSVANFSVLVPSGQQPTLSISNLGTFVAYISRMGLSDYQLYPNYRALNDGYNGGRDLTNYGATPRRFWNNVYLARTNFITATYKDVNNYTNEFTRSYAITLQNNEQNGNGSSVNAFFYLGITNVIKADSICFQGSSSASGNSGGTKFNFYERNSTNPGVVFRGTNVNGLQRMSMFCVADNGGTNQASSNVKATVDFTGAGGGSGQTPQGYIDLLADRLIVARDRTMIASNQTPTVQGTLTFGNGVVDVNTMVLGYQEHSNQVDWSAIGGAQPYLNYCQGTLIVTNGGYTPTRVKINNTLTLGFTADMNPVGSAQQYNNFGRVTLYSNVTMSVSNIICDGGLNFYSGVGRQNSITLNRGATLIVSNTIGFSNYGASDFSAADPRGMALDILTVAAGTLVFNVDPSRTNVIVRTLNTPGTIPSVIKIAQLTGVTSYPAQIPIIAYQGSASPFMTADVSALGAGYFGYILNNIANQTVDLYITTNSPNTLVWTGNQNNSWDTTSINWVTLSGNISTNFNLGDLVIFNDSAAPAATSVTIASSVVPGQTGAGVTISNTVNAYTFSGGTVGGTALTVKQGTNVVQFDAVGQGPINITAGRVVGSGSLGTVTVYSNAVLNYSGNINGGLTSTGVIYYASGTLSGPVNIQGGYMENSGTITTPLGAVITMAAGTTFTNQSGGVINLGGTTGGFQNQGSFAWVVPFGSTLANFGTINLYQPQISVFGLLFGNGTVNDPNGGGYASIANGNNGRVQVQPTGVVSPGPTATGTIGTMTLSCRFDYNNDVTVSPGGAATLLLDVDPVNHLNDIINCDRWNNDTGLILFTNINPGALTFTPGQTVTVFNYTGGSATNYVDTVGFSPLIKPYVPGPGLVWGTTNFNVYGFLTVTNTQLVWDGSAGGLWSTNVPTYTSWKTGQQFVNNVGSQFDDSAAGSSTVNITNSVAPAGERGTILNSNQPAVFPGIIVSNALKNYVFTGAGKITGMTGIYKTGPGTLSLLTTNANDFSGNVIIEGGTLAVTNYLGLTTINSLGAAGSGQMKNDVILDGGTLNYVGTTNVNLTQGSIINAAGGTIGVASATSILTLSRGPNGLGGLTKVGPGTLAMGAVGIYPGSTTVNGGTLRLTAANVFGFGSLILNSSGVTLELTNNFSVTNALNIAAAGTKITILGTSTNIYSGPWGGGGSVTFSNVNPFVFSGSLAGFSGSVSFGTTSGAYQFNNATNKNPCTGSVLASFDLGTGGSTLSNFNGAGLTYDLGALSGGANTILAGRLTNSTDPAGTTYSIGANGTSTTYSGKIQNGLDTVTVVKVGTGNLFLNGASTYTGSTTVSNGVLGGNGSITSPLTILAGATLAPGTSIGTFTVNNNATLGGKTVMEINQSASPSNDLLVVTGTLAGGGTLVITNLGAPLTAPATFKLFSQPVSGFSSTILPALSSGIAWTNKLAVDGTISLISLVNTTPTNIVTSLSGSTLTLSWPADHTGWRLQAQTNSIGSGLNLATNAWFTVPGSTTVNSVNVTIDPANPTVFYRLIYP